MAQTTVTIQMDTRLKENLEKDCARIGKSLNEVLVRFANAATIDMDFLLHLEADPFYSESNARRLRQHIREVEEGIAALDKRTDEEGGEEYENA